MTFKTIIGAAIAATLITGSADRADASDLGDAIAGVIVGGLIVGAIAEAGNHTHCGGVHSTHDHCTGQGAGNPGNAQPPQHAQPSHQQIANRETQSALNYFGFHVGYEDGVLGPRSRSGIAQYQAFMGFAPTGHMTAFERQVLITARSRAQYGGHDVYQVAASSPYGMRGILHVVMQEMLYGGGYGAHQNAGYYVAPQTKPATAGYY